MPIYRAYSCSIWRSALRHHRCNSRIARRSIATLSGRMHRDPYSMMLPYESSYFCSCAGGDQHSQSNIGRQLGPIHPEASVRPRPRPMQTSATHELVPPSRMMHHATSRANSFETAPLLSRGGGGSGGSSGEPSGGAWHGSDAEPSTSGGGSPSPSFFSSWPLLVGLCALSVVICYADRSNISTAILPMSEAFGWDKVSPSFALVLE